MASFGWKKVVSKVSKVARTEFLQQSSEDDDEQYHVHEIDYHLDTARKTKIVMLEDKAGKGARLKKEAATHADSERYWEAIAKWNEALNFIPEDHTIHEMKAQVLMILCEHFHACKSAEKAVEMKPTWTPGLQTLGRALLGIGRIEMAFEKFARAFMLDPGDAELVEEDLKWSLRLLHERIRQSKLEPYQPAALCTPRRCGDHEASCAGSTSDSCTAASGAGNHTVTRDITEPVCHGTDESVPAHTPPDNWDDSGRKSDRNTVEHNEDGNHDDSVTENSCSRHCMPKTSVSESGAMNTDTTDRVEARGLQYSEKYNIVDDTAKNYDNHVTGHNVSSNMQEDGVSRNGPESLAEMCVIRLKSLLGVG